MVVISFQFSTFVSLMQLAVCLGFCLLVVISFQFSTFVSLMQRERYGSVLGVCCD